MKFNPREEKADKEKKDKEVDRCWQEINQKWQRTGKLIKILKNFDNKIDINEVKDLINEDVDLDAFIEAKLLGFEECNFHPLIFYVIKHDDFELFKLIIDNGVRINSTEVYPDSILHQIIKTTAYYDLKNTTEMFKEVLKHPKVDINEAINKINTPLITALSYMQKQFVHLLLEQPSINLTSANFHDDYPLDYADKGLNNIIKSPYTDIEMLSHALSMKQALEDHGATFGPKYALTRNLYAKEIPTIPKEVEDKIELSIDEHIELEALGLALVNEVKEF